tara:strand:+ start:268 stop:480 length:213 start_codon:yes stop_codon:yes gene_type:complete
LNTQSTKISKIDEEKLMDEDCDQGWVAPIVEPPEKDKFASCSDVLAQHNQWLTEQIVKALNDQVKKRAAS